MSCHHKHNSACPFAFTEASEQAQNYGCLPTMHEIRVMRQHHGKTWACHDSPTRPCIGAIADMSKRGLEYQVIDPVLVTEADDWSKYTEMKK